MKIVWIILVPLVISFAACGGESCIDDGEIDRSILCTADYAPVCGCDNITYSNPCVASREGVTFWTEGPC